MRNPPGPLKLPLIGALPWLAAKPLKFLDGIAADQHPIVDLGSMGFRRTYLIVHPGAVQHILQTNAGNYVKGKDFDAMKLVTGEGLVTSEGAHWQKQRRTVQRAFQKQHIHAISQSIIDVAEEASIRWSRQSPNEPLNLWVDMTHTTRSVLLRAILGVTDTAQKDALSRAWDIAFATVSSRLLFPFQLPIGFPTPGNLRFHQARAVLENNAREILRIRRSRADKRNDLVSLLLDARDEITGQAMTDREILDEIMTFFAGGFETSATTLTWAFHLLAQHRAVYDKVMAELDSQLAGRAPTAEDLARLPYLKMVLKETMRLYPGAWVFLRSNLDADTILNFDIPARSRLMLSPYVTHRLPQFWTRPNEFDPDRFASANSAERGRFVYWPFGAGPRQCIGDYFATVEMLIVLAVLLQRHEIIPIPKLVLEPAVAGTLRPRQAPLYYVRARRHTRRA